MSTYYSTIFSRVAYTSDSCMYLFFLFVIIRLSAGELATFNNQQINAITTAISDLATRTELHDVAHGIAEQHHADNKGEPGSIVVIHKMAGFLTMLILKFSMH